jgi:hypothetical protein
MSMKRFTSPFSKKFKNNCHALALIRFLQFLSRPQEARSYPRQWLQLVETIDGLDTYSARTLQEKDY